ncbi:MAG: PfkB family carbohydrate kinase, partial [Mucinivorans sp.]
IEGYLLYNEVLIERAMLLAKRQGLLVALDLASYNIVNEHKDVIKRLVAKYVDIIFANEDEARAYTDLEAEQALEQIVSQCPIAVVKLGVRGSLIARGSERYKIGVIQECISRDKTGAGDLYAAGFLYGLTQGLPLEVCGEIGSILSSYVVEVVGPKMGSKTWAKIREKVSDLQQRQISGAATY